MAQKNFIYISSAATTGGVEGYNATEMFLNNVKQGDYKQSTKVFASGTTSVNLSSANQEMEIMTVKTGKARALPANINGAISQAIDSPISGCDKYMVPNHGDGATSVKTTWAPDTSYMAGSGYRSYLIGGKPQNSAYPV